MAEIKISFLTKNHKSHVDVVAELCRCFDAVDGDSVDFVVDLSAKMLYADFLLLFISAYNYLKSKGIQCKGLFINVNQNSGTFKYAQRINFISHLNKQIEENFSRQNADGRFIEISSYGNGFEASELNKKLINILRVDNAIEDSVIRMLDYCFYEIVDNVLNHAKSCTQGMVVCQKFPNLGEIRLIVCDTGVGVHRGLTEVKGSKYSHLSEYESIKMCTDKGVTNGNGMGNGLYHTKEFIKANKGEMMVYSYGYCYSIKGHDEIISNVPFWGGTFIFLNIKVNNAVDSQALMGGHDIDVTYDFIYNS